MMMRRSNNNPPIFSHCPSSAADHFKILQWNVRSIRSRSPDLASVFFSEKCSIALLSETWLRPDQKFSLPYFNLIRADRADGYGGVAIAAHRSIQIKKISVDNSLSINLSRQSIDLVDIEAFSNTKNSLKLWSLYIPPSSNLPIRLLNEIFQLIDPMSILGGDLNGHHPSWDNNNNLNHRGDIIFSALNNFNLCCLNSGVPTRINRPPFSNTAVDLTVSVSALYWSLVCHPLDDPHGSDHFPVIIEHVTPSFPTTSKDRDPSTPKFLYSKANWSHFSSHLDSVVNTFVFSSSPIDNYNNFISFLNTASRLAIPTKRISSRFPSTSPIWWSPASSDAIKNRFAAFKKYRSSGSMMDFFSYQNACSNTKRILKSEKKNSWSKFAPLSVT
jgi:exonuclease III